MVVKDTGDLAVTPRQMPRKLEHAIRAHTHPTPLCGPRSPRTIARPYLSGLAHRPDPLLPCGFSGLSAGGVAPPKALGQTPSKAPLQTPPSSLRAASRSNPASSAVASRSCSDESATNRGALTRTSSWSLVWADVDARLRGQRVSWLRVFGAGGRPCKGEARKKLPPIVKSAFDRQNGSAYGKGLGNL